MTLRDNQRATVVMTLRAYLLADALLQGVSIGTALDAMGGWDTEYPKADMDGTRRTWDEWERGEW